MRALVAGACFLSTMWTGIAIAAEGRPSNVASFSRPALAQSIIEHAPQEQVDEHEAPSANADADPPRRPAGPPRPQPSHWPRTLTEAKNLFIPPRASTWSDQEIAEAKALCTQQLKNIDAVVIPADTIAAGACGAPAPMVLISIGKDPQVSFSPPPTLTCNMVAALAGWLGDVQPLAKRHLGAPIIMIETMSSYSCRNAYGRANGRLSEHGRANALDIAGFVTMTAQQTDVLADWGMTVRDVQAQVAAAKAAAEKAAADRLIAAAEKAKPAPAAAGVEAEVAAAQESAPKPAAPAGPVLAGPQGPSLNKLIGNTPAVSILSLPRPINQIGFGAPARLGGPKPAAIPAAAPAPALRLPSNIPTARRAQFMRAAHESACRTFGTVLGPEANEAHRNHLHVDMAPRKTGPYCR